MSFRSQEMATASPGVLITGSSGLIGGVLIRHLGDKYRFSGLDRERRPDSPDIPTLTADVSSLDAIRPAFEGVQAVVHLAANPDMNQTWDSALTNGIVATHNVYEAARLAGVRRMVYASSNHAVGMFELDEPYCRIRKGDYTGLDPAKVKQIDRYVPIRPDGYYGVSKAFGEALGAYYAENHGLEVLCLRIGTVNRHNDPTHDVRHLATWCSHRDLAQLVDRCLSTPGLRSDIFYGVSANKWHFWDLEHARRVVGYEPQDNAEEWRPRLRKQ
ncbi:MAG: NAD(P)-dependent oxidoreductase [Chloroflexi bacterium]|nr:NAD(P)-dependent oxidoreductase [Chloroflexota bacterium]